MSKLKVNFHTHRDRYMFLSRMQIDCVNYLNEDNKQTYREPKYLLMGNIEDQIEEMKILYNEIQIKPVWCTLEDIENYEREMKKITFG